MHQRSHATRLSQVQWRNPSLHSPGGFTFRRPNPYGYRNGLSVTDRHSNANRSADSDAKRIGDSPDRNGYTFHAANGDINAFGAANCFADSFANANFDINGNGDRNGYRDRDFHADANPLKAMFRVRLINKVIGPSNGIFPVCGKSTKLYGHASYMPEHGGPVLDMSLEDYDRDKFDIIGNKVSGQQWVPQFYVAVVARSDEVLTEKTVLRPVLTFDNANVVEPGINIESSVVTNLGNGIVIGDTAELIVHPGRAKLLQFNELRKRAKAAGVWKQGMKLADIEKALTESHGPGALIEASL